MKRTGKELEHNNVNEGIEGFSDRMEGLDDVNMSECMKERKKATRRKKRAECREMTLTLAPND